MAFPRIGMQIYARNLVGKTLSLDVSPSDSIFHVKEKLYARELHLGTQTPASAQRLIFSGRELRDDYSLEECNVQRASLLLVPSHAVVRAAVS